MQRGIRFQRPGFRGLRKRAGEEQQDQQSSTHGRQHSTPPSGRRILMQMESVQMKSVRMESVQMKVRMNQFESRDFANAPAVLSRTQVTNPSADSRSRSK